MPEEIDLGEEKEEPEEKEEKEEEKSITTEKTTGKRERNRSKKYELYEVEDEGIKRLNKACPRCGPGIFMANHGKRLACGKCGYTEFKKQTD